MTDPIYHNDHSGRPGNRSDPHDLEVHLRLAAANEMLKFVQLSLSKDEGLQCLVGEARSAIYDFIQEKPFTDEEVAWLMRVMDEMSRRIAAFKDGKERQPIIPVTGMKQ